MLDKILMGLLNFIFMIREGFFLIVVLGWDIIFVVVVVKRLVFEVIFVV